MAGQVKFFFANGSSAVGLIQGGKVKAIAHTGKGRLGSLPDIPPVVGHAARLRGLRMERRVRAARHAGADRAEAQRRHQRRAALAGGQRAFRAAQHRRRARTRRKNSASSSQGQMELWSKVVKDANIRLGLMSPSMDTDAANRRASPARCARLERKPRAAAAARRLGRARAYLRPRRQIPLHPGRGYTPPDAPVEALHCAARSSRLSHVGLLVQGNAHGYDNRVLLDALARYPQRLRGVAITDTRIAPETLRDWHKVGMRGLRFHLLRGRKPGYMRGVGLDVFEMFRRPCANSAGRCRFSATGG